MRSCLTSTLLMSTAASHTVLCNARRIVYMKRVEWSFGGLSTIRTIVRGKLSTKHVDARSWLYGFVQTIASPDPS